MKYIVLISILFSLHTGSSAQVKFISSGHIEYEKRVNQFSYYDKEDDEAPWVVEMKKVFPKMVSETYFLDFNENKSVFKLAKENTDVKYMWGRKPSETDVTVKDVKNNQISLQRDIFEQTYLVKDSLQKYEWKISNETRLIAGFECKKAVTKICDSVYIVAFYTDEIIVSSGPESFGGLPGMILGLAVPRLQVTWFATKVDIKEPTEVMLNPKQKGKAVNWEVYQKDLNKAMKDWGKYGAKVMWNSLL
ncbi:MAG: GLPGLI family protein [Chitinophagaceae bacterium]|nr:GLPGLI family protein [Chitinophagaceae bacterium]